MHLHNVLMKHRINFTFTVPNIRL